MTRACAFTIAASLAAVTASAADATKTKSVTITGCLERDTPAPSTTTSSTTTAAGTSGAERFVLVKGEPGPAGGNTWRADEPNGAWYLVVGRNGKLRQDATKVVEVKGRLDETDKGVGVWSTRSNPPAGTLHMTSIKVLGSSCGE